ncbi:MAG: crosslink repair DNA glycosylase YcaQ family protein [Betaproteobacteria bacterium]
MHVILPVKSLSQQQARYLQLAAQGLLSAPTKPATPLALRRCIERMQLLQIDTIHVVARSPYLVLHSRLGPYPMHWLDQSLSKAHVFETWAHEACFAPMADIALHRSHNAATRRHWGLTQAKLCQDTQRGHLDQLLQHVRENGPVKSSDFERKDERTSAWWGWKDEKVWLEALFASGELMVARRENFQRVYDLSERVCPALATLATPEAQEVHANFIEKSVTALGITQARWINDYFRIKPRLKDSDLDELVARGRLLRVAVQGWDVPGYVHAWNKALLKQAIRDKLQATHTALLSPFDPLIWDRERARAMFNFDYRLECYTPQAKRQFGYFVLPLLHRGELIGRLDAKAHRVEGVFEIKSLYLEPGVKLAADDLRAVATALQACADWHGTPDVILTRTAPMALRSAVNRLVQPSSFRS